MPALKSRHYIALLTLAGAVQASDPEDVIATCARIASTGDRILCLEDALRRLAPAERQKPGTLAEPVSERAAAPVVEAVGESADIGADQLEAQARRNMSREEALAALESAEDLMVSGYRTVPYERLVIELDNGQVWRQIKGDTQRIRVDLSRNQTVDITESSLGGYQLRLNEIRRTIRVERIR
ncbi:MAG: hypothetical protein OEV41_10265 [Gammaproteobacteria bacterium]|nr:hypothetical protein [Gammaproteobacteria bacterium]MDH5344307.1 hypothetical protein [Gammaproteobacteria bacterium]